MKKIIVTVEGGVVNSVLNSKGQEVEHVIIDFDELESGSCPVCRGELDFLADDNIVRCPKCGYDEAKDNAFECAIHWKG